MTYSIHSGHRFALALAFAASAALASTALAAPPSLGAPVDVSGPILGDLVRAYDPSVACTADVCLVVFEHARWDGTSFSDLYGVRFRASDGARLDPIGFVIATDRYMGFHPHVAASGDRFLVAYRDAGGGGVPMRVEAVRVRASDGAVLDPAPVAVCSGYEEEPSLSSPRVASNGAGFLVAWSEGWPASGLLPRREVVRATTVDAAGRVARDCGRAVSPSLARNDWPIPAWTGSQYLVSWRSEEYGVRVRRLDASGSASASATTVGAGIAEPWIMAMAAGDGAAALLHHTYEEGVLHAAILDANGKLARSIPDLGALDPNRLAVAHDGGAFVAAWIEWGTDDDAEDLRLYLRRFGADGSFVDGAPIFVTDRLWASDISAASAGDGLTFVAYTETGVDYTDTRVLVRTLEAEYDGGAGTGGGAGGGSGGGSGGGGGTTPVWSCSAVGAGSSTSSAALSALFALGVLVALRRRPPRG